MNIENYKENEIDNNKNINSFKNNNENFIKELIK